VAPAAAVAAVWQTARMGETPHLHATDTDLLLVLRGRGPADLLERTGDPALLPGVRDLAAAATQ
jgi:hypothetical protein